MKHFLLKFNYGVELGAFLAYSGHYERTKEQKIQEIAAKELEHMAILGRMIEELAEEPSWVVLSFFGAIGGLIKSLCRYCPIWSLDLVARIMEAFAVFNYKKLAKIYPAWYNTFTQMAEEEEAHEQHFKRISDKIKNLSDDPKYSTST